MSETIMQITVIMTYIRKHHCLTGCFLFDADSENDKESKEVMHHLQKSNDDTSVYDIHLVQMSDRIIAKKHGTQNPPGLVLFRNGKPVKFEFFFSLCYFFKGYMSSSLHLNLLLTIGTYIM